MTLSSVVNLVTAATLLAGLLFGVVQVRQFRKVREREAELDMVEDFFSGPIRVSWERLEPLIHRTRERSGRETISEWFQWLSDRMAEREAAVSPRPAHIEHRDWRPGKS